jgi:hypothetical protein
MGILNRLMTGKIEAPALTDDEMQAMHDALSDARRCVAMYANLMNSSSFPNPGYVADVRKLPMDKKMLMSAFKMVLRATTDADEKKYLKSSYVTLAYFQPDVGLQDICISSAENQGISQANGIVKIPPGMNYQQGATTYFYQATSELLKLQAEASMW